MALLLTFTTTETGTGTDTSTSDTTDGLECGGNPMCSASSPPQILSPMDGDEVTSPFLLDGNPGEYCYCDTCGCYYASSYSIYVRTNGETIAEGNDLPLEIELPPGTYELTLHDAFSSSEPITVTVVGGASEGGTDAGDTTAGDTTAGLTGNTAGSDDEAGDSPAQDDGGSKACACSTDDTGAPAGAFALLGLLGLGLARRRD